MSVDDEVMRPEGAAEAADEPGWEVDPDDDWGVAVITTVGRQLRLRREASGMRAADFATAMGYGEDLVHKCEGGKRIPRPDYLDRADEVLNAGGLLAAMKEDVRKVRYPKRVRDLARMEAHAVEIALYSTHNIHGLLQTDEHMRALFDVWLPAYSEEETERIMGARSARPPLAWFKSSYSSSGDGNDCVEVAISPAAIHVRDSKNTTGPRMTLAPGAWTRFVTHTGRSSRL